MNAILPIASYTTGVGFPIQFAYWPKATPFAGEGCKTNLSFARMKSCWKKDVWNSSVASRKFQHGTYVLQSIAWESARAMALIGNAR